MVCLSCGLGASQSRQPNILLITADDLGYEVLNDTLDLTPNLDAFARDGMQFVNAHMNTPICQPSRSVVATGRYGHNSGMMGFMHMKKRVPLVMQTLRDAGYLTGILGKVRHSTPDDTYEWDFMYDYPDLGAGRDPEKYYGYCQEFFARSAAEGKPFYFMVNSHDPHRPFHNPEKPMRKAAAPSRLFSPSEVTVPTYLADLPGVRLELSYYYNSVRRLDDTFGKVIQALRESGLDQNTLVLFVTDNGSAVPFAKANAYLAGTRTPCFWQWPGVIKPGTVDREHFVSSIDFFPTFADAAGLTPPAGVNGRSLVPLLQGGFEDDREFVFTQIDYKIGGPATPMRCVQNKCFGYIFNPWSMDGVRYSNNNEGMIMKSMQAAAKTDPEVAARVEMYRHRVLEEFYDLEKDPGCVNNLIDHPEYQSQIKAFQERLEQWMEATNDPVLSAFEKRGSDAGIKAALAHDYPKKKSLFSDLQIQKNKAKQQARNQKKSKEK
jgi:N-sulfoglucosamine sulfohydrolase